MGLVKTYSTYTYPEQLKRVIKDPNHGLINALSYAHFLLTLLSHC